MIKKYKKILFFDWHKTLSMCDFWGQLKNPTHERNEWHANIVQFLFVENKTLIQEWMRGRKNEEDILKMVFEQFGYPKEILRKDLKESCGLFVFASEKILPLVAKLRSKGLRCVVATDNMDVFQKYVVPALALNTHFDGVLVSSERRVLKFDVGESENPIPFFGKYFKENGFSFSDALLLDDHIDSTGTYERLGFEIFQVKSTEALLQKMQVLAEEKM